MVFEKMTYSMSAVLECRDYLKTINTTVDKKMFHATKLMEIKKAYDFCYDKTKCMLFETDHSYWQDYCKAVEAKASKKELDKLLATNVRFLRREIFEIYKAMELGEVNVIA